LTKNHYNQLQPLYEKYKDRGLEVLAFPCNQFGKQEPGTPEEIRRFVDGFNISFPMFAKCDVNGKAQHEVFRFSKTHLSSVLGSSIKWNFTKFLFDRNGMPIKRFGPPTSPNSMEADIISLLEQEAK
jgi:glutathione peroxidase